MIKISYDYFLNIMRSADGNKFLESLHEMNNSPICEDLKYAKIFSEDKNTEEWDVCKKETTAKFLYEEYKKGALKIPFSILNNYPDYNLNVLERVKVNALYDLFLKTIQSEHGYIFEQLVTSENDESFNTTLLNTKTLVLKTSKEHPDLKHSENQIFKLQQELAEYLTNAYINHNLILNEVALIILNKIYLKEKK